MRDLLIEADYEPLDAGLRQSLERTTLALDDVLEELLLLLSNDQVVPEGLNLLRWAIMYIVVLRDLSKSALLLLNDGGHSRAVIMLRRVAFEYHIRFRFFLMHPDHASTAMGEFEDISAKFAQRVPGQITFIQDPNFDRERFDDASKPYRHFETICKEVHGENAQRFYAHFYAYPSFLLHGNVMMSMDVLKGDEPQAVHLDSARPFTNEIAGNLIVFLLDLAGDVVRTFEMKTRQLVDDIGAEFNERRRALDILEA